MLCHLSRDVSTANQGDDGLHQLTESFFVCAPSLYNSGGVTDLSRFFWSPIRDNHGGDNEPALNWGQHHPSVRIARQCRNWREPLITWLYNRKQEQGRNKRTPQTANFPTSITIWLDQCRFNYPEMPSRAAKIMNGRGFNSCLPIFSFFFFVIKRIIKSPVSLRRGIGGSEIDSRV